MKFLISLILFSFSLPSFAQLRLGTVKSLKGEAEIIYESKSSKILDDHWIETKGTIKTGQHDVALIELSKGGHVYLAPLSEVIIESSQSLQLLSGKVSIESSPMLKVYSVNGQVRTKPGGRIIFGVTATNSYALGVEGKSELRTTSRTVELKEQELALFIPDAPFITDPFFLNPWQFDQIKKNENFTDSDESIKANQIKNDLPLWLPGRTAANDYKTLQEELKKKGGTLEARSFLEGRHGFLFSFKEGRVVKPSELSYFDSITQTYYPMGYEGELLKSGEFTPREKNLTFSKEHKDRDLLPLFDSGNSKTGGIQGVYDPQRFEVRK